MEEKRQSVRVSDSVRISYQITRSFRMVTSNSKDVSEGGIRLPVLQHLQAKTVLDLEIYLDQSGKPIRATAEVVWCKKIEAIGFSFMAGIKFLEIDPPARTKLHTFISKKCKKDPIDWLNK